MISIVIPLFNKEKRIDITIKSVLSQSVHDLEIVVVDDGSTDKSRDVVRSIRDSRVRLIVQDNGGPSKARNTGAKNAKGEWILFLDADDELLPNALSTFLYFVNKYKGEKCIVGNFYTISKDYKKLYSFFYSESVIRNPFWAWSFHSLFPRTGTLLIHKDIAERFPFDNRLRRYEDAEWLFRLMRYFNFVRCPNAVMCYHLQSAEASNKRDNIEEDFLGHLNLSNKSLGEKLALYQLYLQAVSLYPDESSHIYVNIFDDVVKYKMYILNGMTKLYALVIRKLESVLFLFLKKKTL